MGDFDCLLCSIDDSLGYTIAIPQSYDNYSLRAMSQTLRKQLFPLPLLPAAPATDILLNTHSCEKHSIPGWKKQDGRLLQSLSNRTKDL